MNKVNLKLVVVPDNHELQELFNYDPNKYGSIFSSLDEISVNKVQNEYSILYTDETFKKIDVRKLMPNIYNLFSQNLPGYEVHISLIYLYETNSENPLDGMDLDTAYLVMQMDTFMIDNDDFRPGSRFNFIYERDKLYTEMLYEIRNLNEAVQKQQKEREAAEEKRKMEEARFKQIIAPDVEVVEPRVTGMEIYPLLDDTIGDYKYKKKSGKKKKHYDSSRVIKAAGNPKKAVKRHGVIVCKNKKAIRRDEKTIKEFLKDFIPGSAGWKKDFRKDLLNRWMGVYVVSKKELRRLEKKHRRYYRKKDNTERNRQILDFTSKMLNVPVNNWDNPNK